MQLYLNVEDVIGGEGGSKGGRLSGTQCNCNKLLNVLMGRWEEEEMSDWKGGSAVIANSEAVDEEEGGSEGEIERDAI